MIYDNWILPTETTEIQLPIHPVLLAYAGFLFSDAVAAMDREHKLLNKVGSIHLHDKMVEITNKTDAEPAGR